MGIGKFHYLQGWDWNTPRGQGHNLRDLRSHFHEWGLDDVWQVAGKSQLTRNYCDYAEILHQEGILEAYRDDVEARGKNLKSAEREDIDCSAFRFDPRLYVDRVIGEKAVEYLEARPGGKPFFAQISFCGPHPPYDPPVESLAPFPYEEIDDFVADEVGLTLEIKQQQYRKRRAYKAMIHEIDQQIGKLHAYLEQSGLLENTVIIATSDHGEMMGDHGLAQKTSPYWKSSRIPLYIRHPDSPEQLRHDCLVENIDITATILECAGLDPQGALARSWPTGQAAIPARSLMPVVRGETADHRDFIFSECYHLWEMIETSDYKYVRQLPVSGKSAAQDFLYDLRSDPNELHNIARDPASQSTLAEALGWRMSIHEKFPACQTRWNIQ